MFSSPNPLRRDASSTKPEGNSIPGATTQFSNPQPLTSVNDSEIAHFSSIAEDWWDENGTSMPLHQMNPTRTQYIRDKVYEIRQNDLEGQPKDPNHPPLERADALKGLDVLDVGCGGGILTEALARMGATTLGVDASAENITIARLHASSEPSFSATPGSPPPLEYLHATAESLLGQPKRYDVVCALEIIEHVENPAAFLETCAELVKPGGHLFVSTMSRTPFGYFLAILMAEYILRIVPKGTHTWSKFIKPSELIEFFREYPTNQAQSESEGQHPDAPRSWITTPDTRASLNPTEAEVRGMIPNPVLGKWYLANKDAWGSLGCNYIFWVRRPRED